MRVAIIALLMAIGLNTFSQKKIHYKQLAPSATSKRIYVSKVQAGPSALAFYTLDVASKVSVGIFSNDGTDDILIKNLESGVDKEAGQHIVSWDGTDDDGNTVSDTGSYKVKVISSNIQVNWGVIGNTSPQTGPTRWQGYENFNDMCIVGSKHFVALGYEESTMSKAWFDASNPQVRNSILFNGEHSMLKTSRCTTDGDFVYWIEQSAEDTSNTKFWIHATNVADNQQHTFTNGLPFDQYNGIHYNSVIDKTQGISTKPSDIAVNDNFIFITHAELDEVRVFDKTGLQINTFSIHNPKRITTSGNDVWLITGTTVKKYTVNEVGNFTELITLTGLQDPLNFQVSLDGTFLSVIDGGSVQQVKSFNTLTGGSIGTPLGQLGGYHGNDNFIYNDKFMFYNEQAYLAFDLDGSLWLGDYGNMRNQHFTSSYGYIENIAYLPLLRVAGADRNNPTRLFGGFLEFHRDYTKTLSPSNGSWTLIRNWQAGVDGKYIGFPQEHYYLPNVTTLSNGRTYSGLYNDGSLELVELVSDGLTRTTGIILPSGYEMGEDGSLYKIDILSNGGTVRTNVYYKKPLTGFNAVDGGENPVWGEAVELDRVQGDIYQDPIYAATGYSAEVKATTSGNYISYTEDLDNVKHIGIFKGGKFLAKTARSTNGLYIGDFPKDGYFDVGNTTGQGHTGGPLKIAGRLAIQAYHGEGWKQGQVNMYNIFFENGLFVRQFGTSTAQYQLGAPQMAGNALVNTVTSVGQNLYLHHCDEMYQGGIHEFEIIGANTIQERVLPILFPRNYKPLPSQYVELFKDFPAAGIASTAGILTLSSPSDVDQWSTSWSAWHGKFAYKKPSDITFTYNRTGAQNIVEFGKMDLGNNSGLNNYTISGKTYFRAYSAYFIGMYARIKLVDVNNKSIAQFDVTISSPTGSFHIRGNEQDIYFHELNDYGNEVQVITKQLQDIAFTVADGNVTFSYAGLAQLTVAVLDSTANWQNPKSIIVEFNNGDDSAHFTQTIALKGIRLFKTTNGQQTNLLGLPPISPN